MLQRIIAPAQFSLIWVILSFLCHYEMSEYLHA